MIDLSVPLSVLICTLLVALRLAPAFIFVPAFAMFQVPGHAKVLSVLGFAFLLTIGLGLSNEDLVSQKTLFAAAFGELLIGAALATGLLTAFAAFAFAGRLLDLQIGLGIASLFDPVTRAATPLIGSLLAMMAVVIFYSFDGHLLLLRAFAFSFERMPLGGGISGLDPAALIAQGGLIFSLGLALIAPVVFVLFLIDVGMSVLSRTMPQMNIFFLAIAVKVIAGLVLLALTLAYMGPTVVKIFASSFDTLERTLP
jgi:flagellar biosynthesis protein FliR